MDLRGIKDFLKDAIGYILVCILTIAFLIFVWSFEKVSSTSMEPNLNENDVVVLNKLAYKINDIKRNDVVIVKANNSHIVSRVVGFPGETIEYINNYIYINGNEYQENFVTSNTVDFKSSDLYGHYDTIPDDMYLVLGDNRLDSIDSRDFGFVSKENILGKAWIRVWPFNKIKFIK